MTKDFITIAEFEGMHDANLSYICTRLEEVGIQYYLMDSLSSTVLSHLTPMVSSVKLRVSESDAEEASKIIQEVIDNAQAQDAAMDAEDMAWMAEREAEEKWNNTIVNQGLKWGLILVAVVVLIYLLMNY